MIKDTYPHKLYTRFTKKITCAIMKHRSAIGIVHHADICLHSGYNADLFVGSCIDIE